jgi:hypothetical protein
MDIPLFSSSTGIAVTRPTAPRSTAPNLRMEDMIYQVLGIIDAQTSKTQLDKSNCSTQGETRGFQVPQPSPSSEHAHYKYFSHNIDFAIFCPPIHRCTLSWWSTPRSMLSEAEVRASHSSTILCLDMSPYLKFKQCSKGKEVAPLTIGTGRKCADCCPGILGATPGCTEIWCRSRRGAQ